MIVTCSEISSSLQNYFQIEFDVTFRDKNFEIKPRGSEQNLFIVKVQFKDDVRFIGECNPDKYAAPFVESISNATKGKKEAFCACWKKLISSSKLNKVKVNIDNSSVGIEEFSSMSGWSKISIRYTKIPYFEDEESKKENALNTIIDFMALILSLVEIEIKGLEEGNVSYSVHKIYERNPINRQMCLSIKGYRCSVCDKLLEDDYGELAKKFIEVHHAIPVSAMGEHYVVDPINDLFPVCPNCHAMLHKKNPPYTVEELKEIIRRGKKQ